MDRMAWSFHERMLPTTLKLLQPETQMKNALPEFEIIETHATAAAKNKPHTGSLAMGPKIIIAPHPYGKWSSMS